MRKTIFVVAVSISTFVALPVWSQSRPFTVRPFETVVADAAWGAHEGAKDQISEGAGGRKYDIMKCYAMTPSPAFRCVALDMAGFIMDRGFADQLGAPYMDAYFAPNTARNRMFAQYLAANISPEDAMRELSFMHNLIDKTMAADLAKADKR